MKFILIGIGAMAFSFTDNKPVATMKKPATTMKNLQDAYNDEANAVKKYELYSEKAKKEGYKNVADLFKAVAKSESIHMKNHKETIKKLGGNPQEIVYDDVKVKSTKENLKRPIKSEQQEAESMYPEYIKEAKAENANDAVQTFTYAMTVEKSHEMAFNEALANLGNNLDEEYYVSDKTGEIISVKGSEPSPKAKFKGEKFIKVN